MSPAQHAAEATLLDQHQVMVELQTQVEDAGRPLIAHRRLPAVLALPGRSVDDQRFNSGTQAAAVSAGRTSSAGPATAGHDVVRNSRLANCIWCGRQNRVLVQTDRDIVSRCFSCGDVARTTSDLSWACADTDATT